MVRVVLLFFLCLYAVVIILYCPGAKGSINNRRERKFIWCEISVRDVSAREDSTAGERTKNVFKKIVMIKNRTKSFAGVVVPDNYQEATHVVKGPLSLSFLCSKSLLRSFIGTTRLNEPKKKIIKKVWIHYEISVS